MFDAARYLERIGAKAGSPLAELHRAHLQAVPFENLDVHLKRPIRLDEEAFYDKVVLQRRGGFCYELNGLFARLLRTLGYGVTLLSARVATQTDGSAYGPDFDHLTLLVEDTSGHRWLADVGFGECFVEPIQYDERGVQTRDGRNYRLDDAGDARVLWRETASGWEAQYILSPVPHPLADFAGMCHFHQTSPESHFTKGRLCTRATPEGRVTLKEGALVVTTRDGRREEPLPDEAAWHDALARHFGITVR
jgi:N-hydroxyarylamine O-acetyltransferase